MSETPLPGAATVCPPPRRGGRAVLRALAEDFLACVAIAVVLTLLFMANSRAELVDWLWAFLFNLVISTAIGLTLSNLYRFVQAPLLKRFPGRLGLYASHVLILVGGVAFGVEVALRAMAFFGGPGSGTLRSDVLRIGLIVATVAVIGAVTFERLKERARAVELQAHEARQEALRARLEALKARTNPHFLFNSLNTVAGLIDEDPKSAERVLEKLSGLFRYALEGSTTDWVRLERELEVVRGYLEVERVRLGDRLRAEVEVEPGTETLLVPPLVLQPLVENAVLHAVAPRAAGGAIAVSVRREEASLLLEVVDDGPGLGGSRHRGSGTALADLERRLEMAYGDGARLEAGSPPAGGCRVLLTLPLAADATVGEEAG